MARLEFHPARPERDGCFFLEMARQKTVPARTENGRHAATFDWEHKVTVKLGLLDICSLLLVLEGKCEQAGNGRGGLFHDTAEANTVINLRQQTEPVAGLALDVSRKHKRGDGEVQRVRVLLTPAEALGLRCVFQSAIFPMIFGDGGEHEVPKAEDVPVASARPRSAGVGRLVGFAAVGGGRGGGVGR